MKKIYLYIFFLIIWFICSLYFILFTKSPQGISSKTLDPTIYIAAGMKNCYIHKGANKCYKLLADDITQKFTLKEILSTFTKYEERPEIRNSCHEIMHYVGRNEFNKTNQLATTLQACSFVCFEGCLHGAVEGYFIKNNIMLDDQAMNDNTIVKIIGEVCNEEKTKGQMEIYAQCVHGIGHAMMFITNQEILHALSLCSTLHLVTDQELCYSGVFMENSTSSTNKDHPSNFVKKGDPFYPCNILEEKYLKMCYQLQAFTFITFSQNNWQKAFALCDRIPTAYINYCYRSLGSQQVGYYTNFTTINKNCELVKGNYQKTCIEAVIGTLNTRFGGDYVKMFGFCSIVKMNNKKSCYAQIGIALKGWINNIEDIKRVCTKSPEKEYVVDCQNAVGT